MRKPVAEHPDEYWDTIIDINLNAQVHYYQGNWKTNGGTEKAEKLFSPVRC